MHSQNVLILILITSIALVVHSCSARNLRSISTQIQLRDISEPFTIVSIRNYYNGFINHLAPIMGLQNDDTIDSDLPLADFIDVSCLLTTPSFGDLAPSDSSISSNLNSSLCKTISNIERVNIPIDAAHNTYLVLNQEPSIIISPSDMIPLWFLVMKNAMVDQTVRYKIWNRTISEVFTLFPLYEKPYVVEYVYNKVLLEKRGEIVQELEEEVWSDLKLFESVFQIQTNEGIGLGFAPISVSDNRNCNSTLYNSTFAEEYHASLFRIDYYLNLLLNYSNLINSTGTVDNIPSTTFYFRDNLVGNFTPTFLLESIRNVLQKGGFNTYLSYSKPSSTYDIQYFTSLHPSELKPISDLMIHPICFSYYNFYASQYYFRDSSQLRLIFNDIIYFGIFTIGIFVFIFNSVSYCLECKLFVKKRILLPLVGPPTLIIISLCYTVFMRSKFSVATYWILMFIVIFPAPILIGSYMVSLFRFSYLKNMELWNRLIFKSPKIQKYMASTSTSVICSIILTLVCFLICISPIIAASVAILFNSENVPQEMFIIMFAFEVLFMLVLALGFFIVDLSTTGWKLIKRKGLSYYFFYDDPFYYRIDLIIMIGMMLSIIPIIIGSVSDTTDYFIVRKLFSVVFFILFYSILGGTVTIAHWINKLRRLSSKYRNTEVTALETFLEDQHFREMFKTYSKNEFSLENMTMYEELEKLKKSNKVTPQDLKSLQEKFLSSSSIHEVNYPSPVKKSFQELIESFTEEDISSNDSESTNQSKSTNSLKQPGTQPKKGTIMLGNTLELLLPELLKNMFDTFSRLKTTPEYTRWSEMKQIQTKELGEGHLEADNKV